MRSIDATAPLAELLLLLEPVMDAAAWPRAGTARSQAQVRQALTDHLDAAPHDDVVAWCCFSEQWQQGRELWPRVQLVDWETWFGQVADGSAQYYAYVIDEPALRGFFDKENLEASTFDCLLFGHYGDGLMTTMSPVSAGRGEPVVFDMEPEGSGLFTTDDDGDENWVTSYAALPTLREWIVALVDAHVSGRLHFIANPYQADGPAVVRENDSATHDSPSYYFPWPDLGPSVDPVLPLPTPNQQVQRVPPRRLIRADQHKSDLAWAGSDGRVIYLDGSRVKTVDVRNGQELSDEYLGRFDAHRGQWHPDLTRYVVSGRHGSRSSQVVFQAEGFAIVHTLAGHQADWSPLGSFMQTESRSGNGIEISIVSTNSWIKQFSYQPHYGHTWWASTDRYVISRRKHDSLLWSTESSTPIMELSALIHGSDFLFAPDGSRLVDGFGRGTRIADPTTGQVFEARPESSVAYVSWSPDSSQLALATRTGQVEIVDPTGDLIKVVGEAQPNRNDRFLAVHWSSDGSRLLTNCHDNTNDWVIRDAVTGVVVTALQTGDTPVISCVWSPDNERLLGNQYVFDASTGTATHYLEDLEGEGSWSPDSTMVTARTLVDITAWDVG